MAKSRNADASKPTVEVIRRPDGRLDYRPPGEGMAWRTGYADMAALSQAAMREVEPPYLVAYLVADPAEAPAGKAKARSRRG